MSKVRQEARKAIHELMVGGKSAPSKLYSGFSPEVVYFGRSMGIAIIPGIRGRSSFVRQQEGRSMIEKELWRATWNVFFPADCGGFKPAVSRCRKASSAKTSVLEKSQGMTF